MRVSAVGSVREGLSREMFVRWKKADLVVYFTEDSINIMNEQHWVKMNEKYS